MIEILMAVVRRQERKGLSSICRQSVGHHRILSSWIMLQKEDDERIMYSSTK